MALGNQEKGTNQTQTSRRKDLTKIRDEPNEIKMQKKNYKKERMKSGSSYSKE